MTTNIYANINAVIGKSSAARPLEVFVYWPSASFPWCNSCSTWSPYHLADSRCVSHRQWPWLLWGTWDGRHRALIYRLPTSAPRWPAKEEEHSKCSVRLFPRFVGHPPPTSKAVIQAAGNWKLDRFSWSNRSDLSAVCKLSEHFIAPFLSMQMKYLIPPIPPKALLPDANTLISPAKNYMDFCEAVSYGLWATPCSRFGDKERERQIPPNYN